MFEVTFNTDAAIKAAQEFGANVDQLPYVLSSLLNDAVFNARAVIVQTTWPSHVQQRNAAFISTSLRVQKATKENLSAHLYDQLRHGHLREHAESGVVQSSHGHRFTIPNLNEIRRTGRGVSPGQRARAIIAATPKRALRVTPTAIYVGEGGRLHLKYSFARSAHIKADVPFHETFSDVVNNTVRTGFHERLARAMASRR